MITWLIDTLKMPIDILDKSDRTPLHIAVCGGRLEAIELLLRYGANVDAKDKTAWAPLHIAAFRMNENVVRFLVEQAGADVDAICSFGSVADLARSSKEMIDILEKGRKSMNYRKTPHNTGGGGNPGSSKPSSTTNISQAGTGGVGGGALTPGSKQSGR